MDSKDKFIELTKGEILNFYGVDDLCFKLGDKVFEAIEDPDDGYRSYLQSIEIVDKEKLDNKIFFDFPLSAVKVEKCNENDIGGIKLVDVFTNHVWLIIGTDYSESYYPYFIFNYTPDKSQTIKEDNNGIQN